MQAMAASADAHAVLQRSDSTNPDPPFQLKLLHFARRICTPFMEWACVAGFPTMLCIQIINGLARHQVTPSSVSPSLTFSSSSSSKTTTFDYISEKYSILNVEASLQCSLRLMIVTSILSLVAILIFGDTHVMGSDNICRERNNRGTGVVMGSHVASLLYMALLLSVLPSSHHIEWTNSAACRQSLDFGGSIVSDDSSLFMHHISLVERIFHHFNFASLGGFSFALSFLWVTFLSRGQNRKSNKRRTCIHEVSRSALVQNDLSECSPSVMRMCWKIYLSLMIFQSAVCTIRSDFMLITFLLGMHHILLILVYDCKVPSTHQDQKDSLDYAHWQDAFTPGEWMVASTLITSLVGEYLLEYSGILHNIKLVPLQIINMMPIHLVVAHAGLSGCLVGVSMCSILKKRVEIYSFPSKILRDHVKLAMLVMASLLVVFRVAMWFIEVALNSRSISSDNFCEYQSTSCALLTPFTLMIGLRFIPFPIHWLLHFLLSRVDVPLLGDNTSLFRVAVLAYWCCILAVCLPIALILSSWITATGGSNAMKTNHALHRIHNHGDRARKKRTIIARKYFHLVAILLFAPISWLDPDMMSLSYAVAIALLIVIEMARGWTCNKSSIIKQNKCDTKISMPSRTLDNFYMAFLDEKDVAAVNGGLAVTHIALIFGCAFPLWVNQWMPKENFSTSHPLLVLLPFLGLLTLGVGDSISAILGVNFGRLNWPGGSSRTIEGSICMFLSMISIVVLHTVYHRFSVLSVFEAGVPLAMITLIEASTSQIDNLYLPLAGTSMVLLWTLKLSHHHALSSPCTP